MGLLELGDRTDVARAELVRVLCLLALRHEQLADPLLGVGAAVVHVRVVAHDALVDAEEVDSAGVRVGERLEDEGHHLLVLVGLEGDAVELDRALLGGRGQVLDEGVEQPVDAEVARGRAAGHRKQMPLGHPGLERADGLLM